MKQLIAQNWEIYGEGKEKITIDFDRFKDEVTMTIHQNGKLVQFEGEQIEELKNILDSTKYIFLK